MKRTWDFTITLEMSDKAAHKLWELSDDAEAAGKVCPEWRLAERVAKELRKRAEAGT